MVTWKSAYDVNEIHYVLEDVLKTSPYLFLHLQKPQRNKKRPCFWIGEQLKNTLVFHTTLITWIRFCASLTFGLARGWREEGKGKKEVCKPEWLGISI